MLVCRDLDKAENYGFDVNTTTEGVYVKYIVNNFKCFISLDGFVSFEAWDCWNEDVNLDFLYDMIKDGILEKV